MSATVPPMRRLLGITLAVAALGIGAAGCGGGDDDSPAPATTTTGPTEQVALTTDDLISQGDAICAEVNAALGTIEASTADETTKSSQRSDIYDGLAERLGDLGTPSDGDPPSEVIAAAQELADGSSDTTALQEAAADYGFADCAEAPAVTTYEGDSTGTESSPGAESTETYTPPPTTTEPAPTTTAPPTTETAPSTGGGVAPAPETGGSPGGSSGSSSGGSSSGGIGPG